MREQQSPEVGGSTTQAKDLCLRLLTDRAHSRAELAQKLAAKGFTAEVADAALDRLAEVGLVDDAAFARQWVRSRHGYSGKGRQALAVELRRKGIDSDTVAAALADITADDERERAAELVRKKLRTLHIGEDRDKAMRKLVAMLARKGYSAGCAYEVVKTALEQQ